MAAFSLQLAKFADKAGRNAETVIRKVAIDLLARFILRSPVDTGRFRANWQVGLSAVGNRLDATDKAGTVTIRTGEIIINGTPMGTSIWISNSLPYARRLEYGWSKQAPAGMVRVTLTEFQKLLGVAAKGLT